MSEGLPQTAGTTPLVECKLDSAHDLAALLATLQLREREQKDQRIYCEASSRGLKFTAQSLAKDVAVLAWMHNEAFREYKFALGPDEDLHLKLPVAPLLSCLLIFSDRASLSLSYPSGSNGELRCTLDEDGATTVCSIKTLALDEAPAPIGSYFAPGDLQSIFRPKQPEAWHHALSEFQDLDGSDVALKITLHAASTPSTVVMRAQTITSDAEVVLPQSSLDELYVPAELGVNGEVSHRYLLTGVLSSCLRAARDAKAVKVRFNRAGIMSNQFILKARGIGLRDLFCEALVCPLAELSSAPVGGALLPSATEGASQLPFLQSGSNVGGVAATGPANPYAAFAGGAAAAASFSGAGQESTVF